MGWLDSHEGNQVLIVTNYRNKLNRFKTLFYNVKLLQAVSKGEPYLITVVNYTCKMFVKPHTGVCWHSRRNVHREGALRNGVQRGREGRLRGRQSFQAGHHAASWCQSYQPLVFLTDALANKTWVYPWKDSLSLYPILAYKCYTRLKMLHLIMWSPESFFRLVTFVSKPSWVKQ